MSIKGRFVKATLSGAYTYFIYIYIVTYIFNYIGDPQQVAQAFGDTRLEIGDIALLKYYIVFFGWAVVGLSFATSLAEKKTWARQMWNFLRLFSGIVFWSLFIAAGFNTILVGIALGQADLTITVDISLLFYAIMGGKIFALTLVILDFILSFIKEDNDKDKSMKEVA